MLPKPRQNTNGTSGSGCLNCPFQGDMKGFVPDRLNETAEVFILGQNPGEDEEQGCRIIGYEGKRAICESCEPQPFIGATGYAMEHDYLPKTGLSREQVSLGNAIRCRYKKQNTLPELRSTLFKNALDHCHAAHFKLPEKTRVILTQGDHALYAATQEGFEEERKLSDWRGYALPFTPIGTPRKLETSIWSPHEQASKAITVLCTYHIAYAFRDATAKIITQWDWHKVKRLLDKTWPGRLPAIKDGPPQLWPQLSAFDTEYVPHARKFLCYSLYDGHTLRVSEELKGGVILEGPSHAPSQVIMHNAPADIPFLKDILPCFEIEDTMLLHAVLWSDFDHDLGFLGSLYSLLNRWKHLDAINPKLYSAADAYVTWEAWSKLVNELERDPTSRVVYERQKKLVPIIMQAEKLGIRVNQERAKEAYMERLDKIQDFSLKAQAITGWPINLRSNDQMVKQLFDVEGLLRVLKIEPKDRDE